MGKINVLIGCNGRGKTQLLKMLYSVMWSIEQCGRGIEQRTIAQLLSSKIYTTYMPKKIGDIVKKPESALDVCIRSDNKEMIRFGFGKETTTTILNVENTFRPREDNSIFIPAKEVLSLQGLIKTSRSSRYNEPYFDDTYKDLADAITPTKKGKNYPGFSQVREKLSGAIHGRLEYDNEREEWYFKDDKSRKINIFLTSEGVKKMSILDVLLGNRFLSPGSIVFIDEIESALHPALISEFMEMIAVLANEGIQFFIATHSYAVMKKLYIIANRDKFSIPCLSFQEERVECYDLKEGMPNNEIINEFIRLYEEELDL